MKLIWSSVSGLIQCGIIFLEILHNYPFNRLMAGGAAFVRLSNDPASTRNHNGGSCGNWPRNIVVRSSAGIAA
jgi:hypothetical protein